MQPFSVTEQVMYLFSSLRYQALKALCSKQTNHTGFSFPSLRVPGHQEGCSPPHGPWRSQIPSARRWRQPWRRRGKRNSTELWAQNEAVTSPKGEPGPKSLLESETRDPHGQGQPHRPLLPPGPEGLVCSYVVLGSGLQLLNWYSKACIKIWPSVQKD